MIMYQAECFEKVTNPEKYLADLISSNLRPDDRGLHEFRPVIVNSNTISTADGSSVIRVGNTSVVCGIKAELAPPKPEEPDQGYVIINVEMRSHCSAKLRPGPPSDDVQVINNTVVEIIKSSECFDLKKLCIAPEKLAWCLYCDVTCLCNDGSVVDASIAAILTAMKTLKLPKVEYDCETEEVTVDDTKLSPMPIENMFISTSFALYDDKSFIVDPSDFEEEMCGGASANCIITCNNNNLSGFQKIGGNFITSENQEKAFEIAYTRAKNLITAIEKCIEAPDKTYMLSNS